MHKLSILVALVVLVCFSSPAQVPNAEVTIHQNTLNEFLNAVGPMNGAEQFNIIGIRGNYVWTLKNARIELNPDQARFMADASVKVGPLSYGSLAVGDVDVKYNPETNRISVKVLRAVFEVYTKILGKKIRITDIDAGRFYRPEFEFAGPQPVTPQVEIVLPDHSTKTIYIAVTSQALRIERERIVVASQLSFSDHPVRDHREDPRPREHH